MLGPDESEGAQARKVPVEKKWISSGKLGVEAKKIAVAWSLFGRRAEERGACQRVDRVLSFRFFRTILSRAFFLV